MVENEEGVTRRHVSPPQHIGVALNFERHTSFLFRYMLGYLHVLVGKLSSYITAA